MVAGLNHILEITTKPELVHALDPIRKISLELQQYRAEQFPDYLQDMQNDVKSVKYLQQIGTVDSNGLAKSIHFLLDQLRQDCTEYSSKPAPRTEEQWRQLAMMCDRLSTWIKHVPLPDDQFPTKYLTQTIQMLGAFDAHFPKRIPVGLLENMMSMAQNTKANYTSSGIVGNAVSISASSAINNCVDFDVGENKIPGVDQQFVAGLSSCGGHDETHRESALIIGNPGDENKTAADLANSNEDEVAQIQTIPTSEDQASEKELESHVKFVRRVAARSINDFQRSIKAGNCTAEGTTKFRNTFVRMVVVVTTHYPKDCRRLWLQQMAAACTTIL
ncbi:hypothetical protein PHYPSEUDO_008677 [Phytophthora pseudosyringae]|uniref:Uncharacterized protein n=1 Tax=Phytophthora pseudosyringae TaxID=221518 RepID=A0A8T1VE33_9STRA|nr:hypothetical protein PHYPSEUDO_008677 [Phytophthora pseudosyringae]